MGPQLTDDGASVASSSTFNLAGASAGGLLQRGIADVQSLYQLCLNSFVSTYYTDKRSIWRENSQKRHQLHATGIT